MHEKQFHYDSMFLTLTFDDDHIFQRDNPRSLDHTEFQKFMKRLRKHIWENNIPDKVKQKLKFYNELYKQNGVTEEDKKRYSKRKKELMEPYQVSYFMCGEYGKLNGRPHYHAIIYGYEPKDMELWTVRNGERYYISEEIRKLWSVGYHVIGTVTFQSAAYVARYLMKKQYGDSALHYYAAIDYDTGEIMATRVPEYAKMSLNPALGKKWIHKYYKEAYNNDFVTLDGNKFTLPRYYDKFMKEFDEEKYNEIKEKRTETIVNNQEDQTYERLVVREKVQQLKLERLVRELDQHEDKHLHSFRQQSPSIPNTISSTKRPVSDQSNERVY